MKLHMKALRTLMFMGLLFPAVNATAANLSGITSGPNDSYNINFDYLNASAPPSDLLSLRMDGSTATAGTIVWDSIGMTGGTADAPGSITGVDTSVVTFNWGSGGFTWGENFSLTGVDPDFLGGNASVSIGQMAGMSVDALFADGSSFQGVFVDNPAAGAGLYLSQVPIPAAAWLFGTGLIGLAGVARRKKALA